MESFVLDQEAVLLLAAALAATPSTEDRSVAWSDTETALAAAGQATLPAELLSRIAHLNEPGGSHAVLVHGLLDRDGDDDAADRALVALVAGADLHVFSYLEQGSGRVVHRIEPVVGRELDRGNAGRVPLPFHSDDAAVPAPFRADTLALLCLNNDCGTATFYLSARDVVARLSSRTIDVLTQPRFRLPNPDSFVVFDNHMILSDPRPLLRKTGDDYQVACATYNAVPVRGDDAARHALFAFRRAVSRAAPHRVVLERGNALVFSNLFGVHARDAVAGFRSLRRVYARSDLSHLRAATGVGLHSCVFPVAPLLLLSEAS